MQHWPSSATTTTHARVLDYGAYPPAHGLVLTSGNGLLSSRTDEDSWVSMSGVSSSRCAELSWQNSRVGTGPTLPHLGQRALIIAHGRGLVGLHERHPLLPLRRAVANELGAHLDAPLQPVLAARLRSDHRACRRSRRPPRLVQPQLARARSPLAPRLTGAQRQRQFGRAGCRCGRERFEHVRRSPAAARTRRCEPGERLLLLLMSRGARAGIPSYSVRVDDHRRTESTTIVPAAVAKGKLGWPELAVRDQVAHALL
ncbi:hypothetical protein T492DRAFT_938605 [Pavlovales sp. CCMP2436]|nr:hypothetical protein T492DRAFT_938605 [Pavlovales sp. CCMP2436]